MSDGMSDGLVWSTILEITFDWSAPNKKSVVLILFDSVCSNILNKGRSFSLTFCENL